jgi:hypothetical protein
MIIKYEWVSILKVVVLFEDTTPTFSWFLEKITERYSVAGTLAEVRTGYFYNKNLNH